LQRLEQSAAGRGDLVYGSVEYLLIRPGRGVEAADLSDELERCVVQLLVARRVVGCPQTLDVPAHFVILIG
jgi:hypothetical protein